MSITTSATNDHGTITPVTFDLYRDIHKGVRTELFGLTADAGRLDPADEIGVVALASDLRRTISFLVQHAEHEDGAIQPVLEDVLPALAARIASDHVALEARMAQLDARAAAVEANRTTSRRAGVHELYLELCAFTSAYLAHQDDEERLVMPALEAAIGVDAVVAIHGQIIGSIPPDDLGASLAVMLPAMNIDDRAELLGGVREGAPAEVFAALWSLARSVLRPEDHRGLAARLGC